MKMRRDLLREMERTEKRHAREWSELLGERDEWHVREVWLEQKTQRLIRERDEWRDQANLSDENALRERARRGEGEEMIPDHASLPLEEIERRLRSK